MDLLPRDRVRFNGRLHQPRLFGTPGEFHWPLYMISQNIDMTSWVKNIDQVTLVAVGKGGLRRFIVQWRSWVADFIVVHLSEEGFPPWFVPWCLGRAAITGRGA